MTQASGELSLRARIALFVSNIIQGWFWMVFICLPVFTFRWVLAAAAKKAARGGSG